MSTTSLNHRSDRYALAYFILPAMIVFGLIVWFPIGQTIFKSFTNWNGLNRSEFIGLKNYRKLFTAIEFPISIRNSLIYSLVHFVYQVGIGTVLALVLLRMKSKRWTRILRDSYFIPVVLSVTVVSQLWISILNGDFGLLNHLLTRMGLENQNWLSTFSGAIWTVAFVSAWQGMAYHLTIILAALSAIPPSFHEVALIEGVPPVREFWSITLPSAIETYKVCVVLVLTWGFRAFEHIYIMTSGGPGFASYTMAMILIKAVFNLQNYGYGCAVAVIIVLECLLVMGLVNWLFSLEKRGSVPGGRR